MDQQVADIPRQGFHASRLKPQQPALDITLTDALAERFYVDQQGALVSNGLSTEMIFFPGDLALGKKGFLAQKIRNAMEYASAFKDVEELNALSEISAKASPFHSYNALGLYLYLADECSRLKPDTTFLTAMRQAGAKSPPGEKYSRSALLAKTMGALRILGMEESHGAILKEWADTGNFTVQGQLNGDDGKHSVGAYARLARDICLQQTYIGMNLPISYALGNKRAIRSMSAAEAYEFTRRLTCEQAATPPHPYIRQAIAIGNTTRERRIREIINNTLRPQWKEQDHPLHAADAQEDRFAKDVLQRLPASALEILYREGYDCAYTSHASIQSIYPKEDLPGNSHADNDKLRDSRGFRQGRYRAIFLSPGQRPDPKDIERDPALRSLVAAQTLMHEITHIALGYLSEEERKPLKDAVNSLHVELEAKTMAHQLPDYFNDCTKTIPYRTLRQVLQTDSGYYARYDPADKWEEVACNLSGLMHSEFPYPPHGQTPAPYADVEALGPLADKINGAFALALSRCKEAYRLVEMPCNTPQTDAAGRQ